MDNTISEKLIKCSTGIIRVDENMCSDEYDLIYWSYFIPNGFNKNIINIIGEAGFDCEFEKNKFSFDYYRNVIVTNEIFN